VRGRFRRTKRALFYAGVRALQGLARGLPRPLALRAFARIGDLVHLLDRPAIRRSRAHLTIAFGDTLDAAARDRIVREMFRSTGRSVVDLLRPPPTSPADARIRIRGREHLDEALARGGVVALSAHLGNWEVMGAALASAGYPLHVVAREVFDRRSDRLLNDWRQRAGIVVHRRSTGLLAAARALRRGAVLGTLVDQDTGGPSVFVDFFGRSARTPRAPFVLARRCRASLVPMWVTLAPDGVHQVVIRPALELSALADPEAALRADVAAWHAELEGAIRSAPDQWVWHHRRWKSRPPVDEGNSRQLPSRIGPRGARGASREMAGAR
jgi:KDO2-lipid IV(A) lauroyltransferase